MRKFHLLALALVLAAAVFATPAAANIPASSSVQLPVLFNSGLASGTTKLTAQYTDTGATLSAAGGGIAIGAGFQVQVTTCLKVHLIGKAFNQKCAEGVV